MRCYEFLQAEGDGLIPVWDETSKGLEIRYEHKTSSEAVTRSAEAEPNSTEVTVLHNVFVNHTSSLPSLYRL
jgi:hypothetical protein